jgi:beta-galactosidase
MQTNRCPSLNGSVRNRAVFISLIVLSILITACAIPNFKPTVRTQLFDSGWKFNLGDLPGSETIAFDDAAWRSLDLPHDWSIENLAPQSGVTRIGPFSSASPGGGSTGHVMGGTGWYRKSFFLDPKSVSKQVSILFDGVYMESDVWINGKYVGFHPYGYTPFGYNITPFLNPDGPKNLIAVKVNNPGKNSRWYSGSGIYRHVELVITNQVHLAQWGNYVTTPEVSKEKASVKMESTIENNTGKEQKISVVTLVINPKGETVAAVEKQVIAKPDQPLVVAQQISVTAPSLWSPGSPSLYKAVVSVKIGGAISDQTITPFGIRSLKFDARNGFLLNGEKVILKGGCMHHDNGILGAATFDRAEERRVELMKKFGFNAIRTSHNPPSRQFLDACDRLGIFVIDEAFDMWEKPKNPEDYHRYFKEWHTKDLQSMILRDRNHPSVIIWSVGNEIPERADPSGLEIRSELVKIVKELDATRPVTEAICEFWEKKGRDWKETEAAFAGLDIGGYNYQWKRYESDHLLFPNRIMAGTESFPKEAFENWQMVKKQPYVIGDFVWTAFDYLGESAIGHATNGVQVSKDFSLQWPWFDAWCGDIDICGFKKDQSYYRDVVWGISDLEMAVHAPVPSGQIETVSRWGWPDERQSWNWKGAEGKKLSVSVYSNYPFVQLELNGKVIGTKAVSPETKLTVIFQVPYEPGELKAIGLNDGKEAKAISFKTTGAAAKIRLTPDRSTIKANRNDLSYVTVELLDADGNLVRDNDLPVTFTIAGAGEAAAIGSGDPKDMRSFKSPVCNTFRGRCLVILRPSGAFGEINLSAQAQGLNGAGCKVVVN